MAWGNSHLFKEHQKRRSERYGKIGREFEQVELRKILQRLVAEGKICEFSIAKPHSAEDGKGKDATITKMIDGKKISVCFGVTISMKSHKRACLTHPQVPQFCFPIGTKPETIERRIMELF